MHDIFSQAFVQQAGASDDFQELCSEEKGVFRKKFSMDAALEDKICDLYDLFVDVQISLPLPANILIGSGGNFSYFFLCL